MALRFSCKGRAKKACAFERSSSIFAIGAPWPVIVKKPISRQAESICRATACLAASPPPRAADRSMTGICCMTLFTSPTIRSMVIRTSVHYQGLPGDESRIRSRKKSDCTDEIGRVHVAGEDTPSQRGLFHSGNQRCISFHPFTHRKSRGNTIDEDIVAAELGGHGPRERHDRAFAGHIVRHERIAFESDARGHVYDASASSKLELRENRTRA